MSGDSWQAQRADFIKPPLQGEISVLATATAVATQDLRLCGNQTVNQSAAGKDKPGLLGHYVRFTAVGADVYFAFAPTAGALAGLTTVATGVNAAAATTVIVAGTFQDFLLPDLPIASGTLFIGYMTASGSGTLRITQASQ